MSAMVQMLLSLTRQQAAAMQKPATEPIRLAAAITGAWPEMASAASRRQLSLTFELAEEAIVKSQPGFACRRFSEPPGKHGRVHTGRRPGVEIKTAHADDRGWSLQITNTCHGLSAEDLPRLFEPFWRADLSRTGMTHVGLGLTLVKAYCDAMDVSIQAAFEPAGSLTMTLHFQNLSPTDG